MIEFLKGRLVEKSPTYVTLDCNGVGYFVQISLNTFSKLPKEEFCHLWIFYSVNVDVRSGKSDHSLYGFADKEEREIFKLLISISGISANTARMILSSLNPAEIGNAVLTKDTATITTIKGIGPKMAQKIVHELADKFTKENVQMDLMVASNNTNKEEALSALVALGFDKNSTLKVLNKVLKQESAESSVEDLVKKALKHF